jgi:hypothetical protein
VTGRDGSGDAGGRRGGSRNAVERLLLIWRAANNERQQRGQDAEERCARGRRRDALPVRLHMAETLPQ